MLIKISKGKDKPNTLTCTRDDGSASWVPLKSLPIIHDLLHYSVETTLGYTDAFYGLVNQGWDIGEFGEIDESTGKKRAIPVEAGIVECTVGVIQGQIVSNQSLESGTFNAMIGMSCTQCGFPAPDPLNPLQVDQILSLFRELESKWQSLQPGESLEIVFHLVH